MRDETPPIRKEGSRRRQTGTSDKERKRKGPVVIQERWIYERMLNTARSRNCGSARNINPTASRRYGKAFTLCEALLPKDYSLRTGASECVSDANYSGIATKWFRVPDYGRAPAGNELLLLLVRELLITLSKTH